uniref:non-specific serine/threonine protein kinase n=1 Tax=Erpetoichthys calabaricus TaxID=27687 RepID=A0A8C4XHQ2_ERPCA
MAQLTEETQPTFETTLKSKAVSEDCNVKFSCVVSGHPEPELTWYKDDVEMDRYCGLPKYEIFRNGKVHTLHIYNCTEDDAAIYQASARNSKGIVSCSGVLEVATMTEYKIHQRWFAKLKQKAAVKMKELEESRKRGKENVIEIHEQLRTTSPERVQRKRRSPGEANILSPASLQSRNDAVKTNIPDTESRLQEDASDVKESASDVPNGFLAGSKESHDDSISEEVMLENGNDFLTYIYETVEIVTKRPASKEFLAKKKKKISNQVDGGQGTEEGEKRSNEEHAKSNESMSLAQYLAESLMSQIPEGKEKTVESSDLMDETPVLITQSSRISEQSNNIQTTLHKETEFPKSPPFHSTMSNAFSASNDNNTGYLRVCWSQSQPTQGTRQEPIPGRVPTHRRTHTNTPTHQAHTRANLESPIHLTCMSLDCGRKPERPEETHADTGRTCKLHTGRTREANPGPQVSQLRGSSTTHCATMLSFVANTVIADVLGLSSVPSIRVDDTLFKEVYNQQEASPQTEKKDKPLTQHSSENSPKLKHNEILPLIPSATPEELASGARRKIFISKSKGDELDGTILDNQVKKEELSKRRQLSQDLESPCASPGQSRRGLTFLQPPMAPHTTPVEKCSPKLNRKVSTLEVPKLYEDTNVKNESNKDFKTDIKAEDMKKQQAKDLLKWFQLKYYSPQVIRKIRGEQFSDTSGHLKLWCQFFNILSESTIMWYRDDVPVAEVRRSSGDEDQVALAIVQASSKDCGVYTCAINNEYGYDSTDYLLSAEILSEFIVREEVEVGEEIEMTTMLFTKGLADSGSWGEKLFGRIMTVEACVGSGWKRKLCKVKVIYGLDPVFESSTTCIIKIRNPIAYGTKKEIGLIEKNQEISKQECKIQNTAREYCKIFAAEARLISNFGAVPEIIPLHLIYRPANSIPYATVEVDLEGSFVTYSIMDNMGNIVSRNTSEEDQKCCAFQHWIYQWTNGNLLVTELEGKKEYKHKWNNDLKKQCFKLYLHQCNYYCGLLGLRNLKNTEVQLQGKIKGSRSPLLNRKAGSGSSSPQTQKKGMISPQAPRKGPVSPKVIKKSDSGDTKSTVSHKTVEIPKSVRMR